MNMEGKNMLILKMNSFKKCVLISALILICQISISGCGMRKNTVFTEDPNLSYNEIAIIEVADYLTITHLDEKPIKLQTTTLRLKPGIHRFVIKYLGNQYLKAVTLIRDYELETGIKYQLKGKIDQSTPEYKVFLKLKESGKVEPDDI